MEIQEKLLLTFSVALGLPLNRINEDLAYGSLPEWDSVAHMALVTRLESEFGVMLDTEDIIAMSSLAECRRILSKHGVEQ